MYTIQRERLCDFVGQIEPLFRVHHIEVLQRDVEELDIDWDQYRGSEQAGLFFAHVARDTQDKITGYAMFFVVPDLHHKGRKIAHNNAFYVAPESRDGYLGPRLIKHCEREMLAQGASRIDWAAQPGTPLDKLLQALGYTKPENHWTKNLKE